VADRTKLFYLVF